MTDKQQHDPAAIDLDAVVSRHFDCETRQSVLLEDWANLVNAVKALRERVAEYDNLFDLAQKRERPWIEAWRKATGKQDTLPDYGEMLAWLCDRVEAAETDRDRAKRVNDALLAALEGLVEAIPTDGRRLYNYLAEINTARAAITLAEEEGGS